MAHTPHELSEEFPDDLEAIRRLKMSNGYFTRLADNYHQINREVHRMESRIEPVSDMTLDELKKHRLALKDKICDIIRSSQEHPKGNSHV